MKNIYFKGKNTLQFLVVLAMLIGFATTAEAQIRKSFTQRTSQYSPTKKIYNVKGDFTMLGNTNLTPQNYSATTNNNGQFMTYVDKDGDPTTLNSSSSTLVLSTENGAIPECSNIIYAGLYWTGKSSANNTFNVSGQQATGTQAVNSTFVVNHDENITNTDYALSVTRNNPSSSNRNPIYTFTGDGNTYVYNFYNAGAPNRVTLSINGAPAVNVPVTVNGSGTEATLTTPTTITNGTVVLKVLKLIRSAATNLSTGDTQTTSDVQVNVTGTVPVYTTVNKTYNKKEIKLKGPGEAAYTTFTAANADIYYPSGTDDDIFTAYKEITDYVKDHGIGEYFAADIALLEGNAGGTGYSGGWGIVVVYENSKMKYRDVTVFDGYAYVQAENAAGFTLPVTGFNTVQTGPVGLKLGVMASEGDVAFTGDYFRVQKLNTGVYQDLSHSGNSTTNFFNSSINSGGARNPNLVNNTGIDVSMFTVPNPSNSVIGNNQTSTNFKYGTDGDTYSIFTIAMAVDAYIPDVEGAISAVTVNGLPATTPVQQTLPGQIVEYKVQIKNRGTEAINNYKITVPVPYNTTYVANSAIKSVFFAPLPTPNALTFEPTVGANGSVVWDFGTLPLPTNGNPDTVLAEFTFKFKVTEDCTLLKNTSCNNIVAVNGIQSGTGAITGIAFSTKNLIQGYAVTGNCQGAEISAPLLINIDAIDYVNQNCQGTPPVSSFVFCSPGANIPITLISGGFPAGSMFYNQFPVTESTVNYNINNPFPATPGTLTYYAVPPNSVSGCYFAFTITVKTITSLPTASDVSYCQNAVAVPLTATVSNPNYTLYYYTSINGSAQLSITPSTAVVGSTTYYVAEGESATCIGNKKPIVVNVYAAPTLNAGANATIQGCSTTAITGLPYSAVAANITLAQLTAADGSLPNSANIGPYTLSYIDVASGVCPIVVTRTFSVTGTCGTLTASKTITISDTTLPVISALPAPSTISCNAGAPAFATPTATDDCGTPTLTFADVATPGACGGASTVTRTWTATDACGNTATRSQTITVTDNVAPVIAALPAPSTISCPATPVFAVATATDACGSTFTLTSNDVVSQGACAGSYSVTRTWTATDACGNISTASQTINVTDTVAPVIADLPAPSTISCPATPVFAVATAVDACGSSFTLTSNDVVSQGACANAYSVTRTWTATDACGNASTASQTITVQDNTPPVISTPASNLVVECDGSGNQAGVTAWLANHGGAVAADTCSAVTWTNNFNALAADCSAAVTVIFTATDACGNASTTTATFSVQDSTIPVAPKVPASTTVQCSGDMPAMQSLTAFDNCAGDITVPGVDVITPGTCPNAYVVIRTWTFTDACGNSVAVSQTINVNDTIAPVAPTIPADLNVTCASDVPPTVTLIATDNCNGPVSAVGVDHITAGLCANSFVIKRTWTFTDNCGNTTEVWQIINVNDTVAPVAPAAPASVTVSCGDQVPAMISLTAIDNCGESITVQGVDAVTPGTCANTFIIVRTWTFTDACGNTSSASQVINVKDNEAPVIAALPAPSTISCPAVPEFTQAVATDNCAGTVALAFNDVVTQGACAGSYTVTRTWTATDLCGNTATASQTITVTDTVAPVIAALPAPSTINCPAVPVFAQATAVDACGSTFTLTSEDVNTPGACAGSYTVTRTWTATDSCGNISSASQTINVQDVTAPVITTQASNLTVECDGSGNQTGINAWLANNGGAVANDACSTVTWTNNFNALGSDCSAAVTVIFTATDACGNAATTSATFTVQDITAPVAPQAPAAVSVACAADVPANVTLTATDNCSGAVAVQGVDVVTPGSCANSFSIVRTWTFTDACGNSTVRTQNITVNDNVAPVAPQAPAAVSVACAADVPANISLTATDNCAGDITVQGVDVVTPGSCANSFTIVRTWTFVDVCGNTSSVSQIITVNDNIAPVAPEAPATVNVACAGDVPANVTLTATDNCSGTITALGVDVITPGQCANSFVVTRTWTFTDACGNSSSVSQTINVNDNVAPVAPEAPATVTVACAGDVPANVSLTANDNCAGSITVEGVDVVTPGACANAFVVTRTWTFTDACGNTSSVSQTINVNDNVAPVIAELPAVSTINCPAAPEFAQAVATDNCVGTVTLVFEDVNTPGACAGSYSVTRTWTATDVCGNTATATQTINVQDVTAPVITVEASNLTVECDGSGNQNGINAWLANHGGAVANDTCSDVTWTNDFNALGSDCSAAVTVIFTATDACGNASTTAATFTVQDITAPVAPEAPATANVVCASDVPASISLTASDNCSGEVTVQGVDVVTPGACANSFTLTRTWTFIDACGNSSAVSQTINVNDTVAPVAPEAPATLNVACAGDVPAAGELSATDNCGEVITAVGVDAIAAGQCANSFVITRTWTFADACGNAAAVSQTINVNDNVAPVIAELPAPSTISCPTAPEFTQAVATDNCAGDVALTFADATTEGQCAGSYSVTRTWTATDVCGNTATATQTINVEDTTAPVIAELPALSTISCPQTPEFAVATATDACGSAFTLTSEDVNTPGQCAGSYSVTRTWTATDACGNVSTASQTINVQDVTAPVIAVEASNLTVECDGSGNQNAINEWLASHGGAVANDTCSDVTWTNDFDALGNDCSAAVTVIFTATDACGNAATTSATFTVEDATAPVAPEAPATANVVCATDVPANVSLTATDNCAGTITAQGVDAITPGTCANSFVVTRTWTFTDACGNSSSVSQTINVNDTVAPVAPEAPANVTVSCVGEVPNMIALTAIDNCGEEITAEPVDLIAIGEGACANNYLISRTWTFTDACGNSSAVSQTITVNDTIAPVAPEAPADVTASCAGETPAMISLTATDNCGEQITVEGVDVTVAGSCPNSYVTTRTWTFTDVCGNTSSVSQTISVNDTVAPVAPEAPAAITVACGSDVPATIELTATDNCGDQITALGVDTTVAGNCPNAFVVTRTWTFTDACGNSSSVSQIITVNDTIAPVAPEAPAAVSVTCIGDVPAMISLTATDNCTGEAITVQGVDTNTGGNCANSLVITRTWTFTDACGNASSVSQVITVNDDIDPTFVDPAPANIAVSCDDVPTPATLTATDNCGAATVTVADTIKTNPNGCTGTYSIIRTWTASDACGNTTSVQQVIDVQDITAPTFVGQTPVDIAVSCGNIPVAPVLTAIDNCGTATVAFTETSVAGACPASAVITRTWTATDACGNPTVATQIITVSDTTGPVVDGTFETVVNVTCSEIPAVPVLTFSDACSTVGTPVYAEVISNQTPDGYTITRTWTVTDACGNPSTFTQTVNVSIANGTTTVATDSCQGDISPINLDDRLQTLLPGTPTGGTWTDLDNTGGLTGNIWMPSNVAALGVYQLQYQITDGACPRTIILDMDVNLLCIVEEPCEAVIIHNAFSPNGDGINENFVIENIELECYFNSKVEIYNRWGVLVYEAKGYDNAMTSFKGVSEGRTTIDKSKELPTGTYFYIIEYVDSQLNDQVVKKDGYLYLSR